MNRRSSRSLVALAAVMAVAFPFTTASATGIHTQIKGKAAVAAFTVKDSITCAPGDVRVMQTYVGIFAFETTIRSKGQLVTTVQTNVNVSAFNPCTVVFSFNDGQFVGGSLPMTSTDSATLAGHYVLPTGMVVDANLTLTGTGTVVQGHSMQRHNLGGSMVTIRQIGSTRTSTLSGTVTIDGRIITASQMVDVDSSISRNTSGEMIVIRSGS